MGQIKVHQGSTPLLISVPHAGTMIPPGIRARMRPESLLLPDTDWFVDRLYAWAPDLGASLITTPWSRYVIDLNRPPDDTPMYDRPGTSLVPESTFAGEPIYRDRQAPDAGEVSERLERYWRPYHDRLGAILDSLHARHGFALLLDGHSIRSEIPELFDGELPHLNLGSNSGASAAGRLVDSAWAVLSPSEFGAVRDGRFKGGYITRHYGRPEADVHAIQLEIAQRAYMPENLQSPESQNLRQQTLGPQSPRPKWDPARASDLVGLLKRLISDLQAWTPGAADTLG